MLDPGTYAANGRAIVIDEMKGGFLVRASVFANSVIYNHNFVFVSYQEMENWIRKFFETEMQALIALKGEIPL